MLGVMKNASMLLISFLVVFTIVGAKAQSPAAPVATTATAPAPTESNPDILRERHDKLIAQQQILFDRLSNLQEFTVWCQLQKDIQAIEKQYAELNSYLQQKNAVPAPSPAPDKSVKK
jgi:hypothetical protein